MKIVKVFQTEVICYIHCQNRIILFIFLLVNVTVSGGILGTLKVICIFSESWILCQTRSIHQIEKITVVGTKIQQRQSFRYTVSLQKQKVMINAKVPKRRGTCHKIVRMAESVRDFYNNIVNWVNNMVEWVNSLVDWLPYVLHYNPLLIRNRS